MKNIDCKTFVELIQLILDDEASEAQKSMFKEHEEMCGHCAKHFDIENSVIELVRKKVKKDCCPKGFADSVRASILKK